MTGRAAHKRRLAVLAVLALARGRTVGRERLVGLLWGEHPGDAARHLLSESLYVLRKELGEEAIRTVGDEVGVSAEVISCDAAEMERAMDAGELVRAAGMYRGPFLDGFYVNDAPEFERWASGERDRLAALHVRAAECLAEGFEGEGRWGEAVAWWRRLVVEDPFNSRAAVRLMLALDANGERAAALWVARTHTTLLREELDVEPDEEITLLVERLHSEPVRVPLPEAQPETPPAVPPPAPGAHPEPAAAIGAEPDSAAPEADTAHATEDAPPPSADPHPTTSPPRLAPGRPRWPRLAALVAVAAVALLAALPRGGDLPAEVGRGFDPNRIAVLYFDDHSPGGELGYLAAGLTESLIHALAQVEALDVISRNGVKPYRDAAVRFDSMVADLGAGSLVEGSVQPVGDSVRVTVQLIDANSNSHLESITLIHPLARVPVLEEELAAEVAASLRRRLGRQVELHRTRGETRSEEAWRRVMQAGELRDDAARLARSRDPLDAASADRYLVAADSLLALAERADPGWTRPALERGWIAHRRALAARLAREEELDAVLVHVDRVLRREPGNARALELRGTARLRAALASADAGVQDGLLEGAERDLRAAVAAEPTLAAAWGTLGQLLRYRGHFAEAQLAARRALAEDAYLEGAEMVLHGIFFGALLMGDYTGARSTCDEGRRRFPEQWRFYDCRLTLMREDAARPVDTGELRRLAAELERIDPPARARAEGRAYSPLYRMAVVAAVLARAGEHDDARALIERARREVAGDEALRLSLAYDEAHVRLLLGEREAARRLLEDVLSRRPALRAFAERDPLLAGILPREAGATGNPRADGGPLPPPGS